MGKFFIPMYRYTTMPYQTRRPQSGYGANNSAARLCDQSLFFNALMDSLLGQLYNARSVECNKKRETNKQSKSPWVYSVNLKGFNPEDITVKVNDGAVHISARQVEETETGHDVVERFRKIQIPKDVDDEKLNCFSEDGGKLILTAPYVEKTPSAGKEQRDEPESLVDDGSSDTANKTHGNMDVQTGKQPYEPEVIDVSIDHVNSEVSTTHGQTENKVEIVGDQNVISGDINDSIGEDESKQIVNDENGKCEKNEERDTSAGDGDMTDTENFVVDNTNKTRRSTTQTFMHMVIDDRQGGSSDKGLDITLVDDEPNSDLTKSSTIREFDGIKHFEMTVNLGGYTPEDIKVQLKDGGLQIDAEREVKTDTFVSYQKTQRKFSVPKSCVLNSARVEMNKSGSLRVTVPLKEMQNEY